LAKRGKQVVFLDVAKAFDTVWTYGLLHKLRFFRLASSIPSLHTSGVGRSKRPSRRPRNHVVMLAGVAQGGLISPFLFTLHVKDFSSPLYQVWLPFYMDDTAIIATSRKPTLLVSYLES
jgi:hypothetical protein